jgi:predicted nucleotidyltransferase component of viral defense system
MKIANATSIRAALLNLSRKENLVFQQVVTRYLHERILYRISISNHASNLILKGGNLLYAIEGLHARPTVDIDILAKQISNDRETLTAIFRQICEIKYEHDCVYFDAASIVATDIAKEKKYSGVRMLIHAQFDTIKQTLQVDVGFGDVITPAPVMLSYPLLLKELDSPEILAYSIETVIAEKFEAIIHLGQFNSRMKDFYDIYILLKNHRVCDESLQDAISNTFRQRNTSCRENHELFSDSFYHDESRQTRWKSFLKKINADSLNFETVVIYVTNRLLPIYNSLIKT